MKVSNALTMVGLMTVVSIALPARHTLAATEAAATAPQMTDGALESQVAATLKKDSVLAPRDIDVEARQGSITLTGTVRTVAEKERAATVAKIAGVTHVVNQIEVNAKLDQSKTDAAAQKTKEGLNKAVDATAKGAEKTAEAVQKGVGATEKGVGKAAEKTAEAVGTAGEKVTDASLTTRVKSGFGDDPLLKDTAVQVQTVNRVVTLKGTVPSAEAKTRAGEIAARTSGVTRVVNDLEVR
jgi:hyperosmotically inducible periplasmic protein